MFRFLEVFAMTTAEVKMPVGSPASHRDENDMAKNDKRRPGRPSNETPPLPSISTRPYPELAAALDAFLQSVRPKTTTSAVLIAALEDYLTAKGFPPADYREQPESED